MEQIVLSHPESGHVGVTPVSFGGLYQRVSLGEASLSYFVPFGCSRVIWKWICAAGLFVPDAGGCWCRV